MGLTLTSKPKFPVLDRNKKLGLAYSCWPFHDGGGSYLLDISGNNWRGIFSNAESMKLWGEKTLERNITGVAYTMDGVDDIITVSGSAIPKSGDFSISMWFNPSAIINSGLTDDIYLFRAGGTNTTNDIRIFFAKSEAGIGDGTLNFWVHDGNVVGTWGQAWSNTAVWDAATWYHVIATYRAETKSVKMYVNGVLQMNVDTLVNGRGTVLYDNAYFGAYSSAVATQRFSGIIDNVIVYDTELFQAEVTTLNTDPLYHLDANERISVSSSFDFRLTRNKIISRAFRIANVIQSGQTPSGTQIGEASDALNSFVKSLQAEKKFLWTIEWAMKPYEVPSFVIGTDGLVYRCIRSHFSQIDNCPTIGLNYKSYWYPDAAATTQSVWSQGANYKSACDFELPNDTLSVEEAVLRDKETDLPLTIITNSNYFRNISTKYETGTTQYAFVEYGIIPRMFIWPAMDSTDYIINYRRVRKLRDLDTGSVNADFPERFSEMLVYGLAEKLADEHSRPLEERNFLMNKAAYHKNIAFASDREQLTVEYIESAY